MRRACRFVTWYRCTSPATRLSSTFPPAREDRKRSCQLLGFANSSTISSLVMRALKHAGVESAPTGAHVLDEIGELLRHQSPNTTAILRQSRRYLFTSLRGS